MSKFYKLVECPESDNGAIRLENLIKHAHVMKVGHDDAGFVRRECVGKSLFLTDTPGLALAISECLDAFDDKLNQERM